MSCDVTLGQGGRMPRPLVHMHTCCMRSAVGNAVLHVSFLRQRFALAYGMGA